MVKITIVPLKWLLEVRYTHLHPFPNTFRRQDAIEQKPGGTKNGLHHALLLKEN
jgi:hypothetical protein